jgi:DNA-binding transcriptional ArsR family regulator
MHSVDADRRAGPVKDLSPSPPGPKVMVDHGLGYELVLSLRMWVDVEDPVSYAEGPAWFERVRRVAPAALLADVMRYCGGHELLFGHLLGLVIDAKPPRDPSSLIERVSRIDEQALRRHLLGYHLQAYRGGVSRALIARAADGEPDAEAALLAGSDDEHAAAYRHLLQLGAGETRDLLVGVLEGWTSSVMEPGGEIGTLLDRSAAAASGLVEATPFDQILDLLSPGCRYEPEPGIDRLLLVPSWVGRPWLVMCEHDGAKIFCFPANDDRARGVDEPPAGLATLYRALGEENRLRLLRRLAGGTCTLQELTDHVGLAKSTVHGHLLALRTSGLVALDVVESRYSLRPGALDAAGITLDAYLGRDRS